jgi:phage terminase large subunit
MIDGDHAYAAIDGDLVAELVSIKYKFTSSGRMQIESKSDAAKRGLASPDSGDALCLTFASQAATLAHGSSASSNWSEPLSRNLNVV